MKPVADPWRADIALIEKLESAEITSLRNVSRPRELKDYYSYRLLAFHQDDG
jgi:hypothetical protein